MSPLFDCLILSPFKEHIRHILLLAVYLRALCSLAKVTLVIVMVMVMASFVFFQGVTTCDLVQNLILNFRSEVVIWGCLRC